MSFFKKRENIILTSLVVVFFIVLALWHDVGGFQKRFLTAGNGNAAFQSIFVNGNDETMTLAEFRGKPLIVNFWATWCPVCVKKMGSLNDLAEKMKAAGGEVLAISSDQTGISTVKAFYIKNDYRNLPIYIDPRGNILQAFGARGLPTAVLIDANGNVVGQIEGGFDWTSPQAYDIIKDKLGIDLLS